MQILWAVFLILFGATICSSSSIAAESTVQGNGGAVAIAESAPVPGGGDSTDAPAPSAYQQLPLSVTDVQMKITELKALQDRVSFPVVYANLQHLYDWILDLSDAHSRIAQAFGKSEGNQAQCQAEWQTAHQLAKLKNQVLLMKAELLIRQHRNPEALQPLVDVVAAEPKSSIGYQAYKYLREIGFSPDVDAKTTSPVIDPGAKPIDKVSH